MFNRIQMCTKLAYNRKDWHKAKDGDCSKDYLVKKKGFVQEINLTLVKYSLPNTKWNWVM